MGSGSVIKLFPGCIFSASMCFQQVYNFMKMEKVVGRRKDNGIRTVYLNFLFTVFRTFSKKEILSESRRFFYLEKLSETHAKHCMIIHNVFKLTYCLLTRIPNICDDIYSHCYKFKFFGWKMKKALHCVWAKQFYLINWNYYSKFQIGQFR